MRTRHIGSDTRFLVSKWDTGKWAEKWPCSTLRGHRLAVTFDNHGDLVDISVDGRHGPEADDIDGYELLCMIDDIAPAKQHPARVAA